MSFLEGSDVYLATALGFLRLHEEEIMHGEDIADVVRAQALWFDEVACSAVTPHCNKRQVVAAIALIPSQLYINRCITSSIRTRALPSGVRPRPSSIWHV